MTMGAVVADATAAPIRTSSVDLIVTSPPYFGLRSYSDHPDEIGAEATVEEFVTALVHATEEMARVLKPTGSIFVNLADRYGDGKIGPRGDLLLIPHRYALAARDRLGLILRSEIIWHKPQGIPENQKTRHRRNHEVWFHFALQADYFADGHALLDGTSVLPSSVQAISPETYPTVDDAEHPATFPVAWPKQIILGWSPVGWCETCGEPARTSADRTTSGTTPRARRLIPGYRNPAGVGHRGVRYAATGLACACDETGPLRPSVVLDPFGGSGTTAHVASALGRLGLSCDLSRTFASMSHDAGLRDRRARQTLALPKPPETLDGQNELF